jgi:hypothetical protein
MSETLIYFNKHSIFFSEKNDLTHVQRYLFVYYYHFLFTLEENVIKNQLWHVVEKTKVKIMNQ